MSAAVALFRVLIAPAITCLDSRLHGLIAYEYMVIPKNETTV